MRTSTVIAVVVVVVVVAVAALYASRYIAGSLSGANVYVYLTDKPIQVQHLYVTISSIMFHNVNGGWATCSNASITVDLASLINTSELATSCKLPNGTYNLIFLKVSSIKAVVNGNTVDCTLPSGTFKVPLEPSPIVVNGTSYNVKVDMGAVGNVNITGNGKCIVRPVIRATASKRG